MMLAPCQRVVDGRRCNGQLMERYGETTCIMCGHSPLGEGFEVFSKPNRRGRAMATGMQLVLAEMAGVGIGGSDAT